MTAAREPSPGEWLLHLSDAAAGEPGAAVGGGRGLAELARAGLPVPAGYVLTAGLREEAARLGELPPGFDGLLDAALERLERATGTRRGDPTLPLFVDVVPDADGGRAVGFFRLGLSPSCIDGLIARIGDSGAADRALRAHVIDFAARVHGVPRDVFVDGGPAAAGALTLFELLVGAPFPESLAVQLRSAVEALLETQRLGQEDAAPNGPGLLVTASVLGGAGAESGVGRIEWSSDRGGAVTVRFRPDDDIVDDGPVFDLDGMRRLASGAAARIDEVCRLLEQLPERPVSVDFVVEAGELVVVDRVAAARAGAPPAEASSSGGASEPRAALSPGPAVSAVREASIETPDEGGEAAADESVARPRREASLLDDAVVAPVAHGHALSSGIVSGRIVFDSATALHCHRSGLPVILARAAGDDADLRGLAVARALLVCGADGGGRAVAVAVRMGLPTISLVDGVALDRRAACLRAAGQLVREGDLVTIDADEGRLFLGALAVPDPREREA